MNHLNRNKTQIKLVYTGLVMLMLFALNVNAQNKKIIFSNTGAETDIQGNATINIVSGDITVETDGDKLIVEDPGTAILGFYPSAYQVATGASIDVNWSVAYAGNCVASVPSGNASWSGTKNSGPGSFNNAVTINSVPTKLRLSCNNLTSGTTMQEFTVVQESTGGGTTGNPVAIDFYMLGYQGSTTPPILGDGNVSLRWSTANATSCTASSSPNHSGWSGSKPTSSNGDTVFVTDSPTFTLSCTNGTETTNKSLTFNNSGGGGGNPPVVCQGQNIVPPKGMTAKIFDFADERPANPPYPQAVPGQHGNGGEFMDTAGQATAYAINPDSQYIALGGITIPNFHDDYENGHMYRALTFGDSTAQQGGFANIIYSVSTCPGDFDTTKTAVCKGLIPIRGTVRLTTDASHVWVASGDACLVQKDETYYVNFLSGVSEASITDPSDRRCWEENPTNGLCGSLVKENGF